ncbi:MAG TPA: hypothetical protein PLT03_02750 [Bacillota bacterium]|nr:hypothetical protein [Bacillota bacterium]HOA15781.1 hypothetical protein [Bacillota bacterium]HOG52770.1 hypothetical protein [Bacillota bacterium]
MDFVIGVDPGLSKVGLALLEEGGRLVKRCIVPRSSAAEEIAALSAGRTVEIALGDGTKTREVEAEIISAMGARDGFRIVRVDERNSTVEGRRLFLLDNRKPWWARLIPIGLRTPDRPWDDYVAEVIARRYLSIKGKTA